MSNDDISLEPLFNQSAKGVGADKKIAFVPIDTAGEADHRDPITITSTPTELTLTLEKTTIELQNTGSKIVYYGGAGVTFEKGIKLFPNTVKVFANIKDTFSLYLVTEGAETAEVRIVEYA